MDSWKNCNFVRIKARNWLRVLLKFKYIERGLWEALEVNPGNGDESVDAGFLCLHSWAWDNSSLARDTPFSNTTPTRRFQRERDSGSTQPIFKIKADSVREKVHPSFAARRFLKRNVNF